jgi:hypothetical protein
MLEEEQQLFSVLSGSNCKFTAELLDVSIFGFLGDQ